MADATAPTEEPLFDPSLKKRKAKKKAVVFDEEPPKESTPDEAASPAPPSATPGPSILKPSSAPSAPEGELKDDFGFGEVKKKKKKKDIPLDLGEGEASMPPVGEDGAAAGDELADFSDLKKKKKKSAKKAAFDIEAFEKELGSAAPSAKKGGEDGEDDDEAGGEGEEGDLGDDVFALPNAPVDVGDAQETWHGTDRDYSYQELLGRIVKTLRAQNPDLSASGRKRYTIVPPSVHREGNKKTIFANI
ncbi:hypothetical protein FRB99_001043, partial [Tulasnella sp. 403]